MAIEFSAEERGYFTGVFNDYFNFNCQNITINKEPVKIINQINVNPIFGYGDGSTTSAEETYQTNSQNFSGVIVYPLANNPKGDNIGQKPHLKVRLNETAVYLKVKKDCRDFIKNGRTENIVTDDGVFNVANYQEIIQNYLGLKYYYFELKGTN